MRTSTLHLPHLPAFDHVSAFGTRAARGMSRFWTAMKIARMQSALNAMTDAQLAQAGTTRGAIRSHAERLILRDYDGL